MMRKARKTTSSNGLLYSSRKVVKSGNSLVVSLPAEWVNKYGVKPGDVLALVAGDCMVALSPKPEVTEGSR